MKSPTGDSAQLSHRRHWLTEQTFVTDGPLLPARSSTHKRDGSSDLKDTKRPDQPKRSGGDSSDMRVVGIDFNPGPDAEERLRRLFALLVKYATRDKIPVPEQDLPSDGLPSEASGKEEI